MKSDEKRIEDEKLPKFLESDIKSRVERCNFETIDQFLGHVARVKFIFRKFRGIDRCDRNQESPITCVTNSRNLSSSLSRKKSEQNSKEKMKKDEENSRSPAFSIFDRATS